MLSGKDYIRYSRHLLMADVGEEGQQRLKEASVLIVGLGGLGCPVAMYLAAAGVGYISLCDGDTVELSNLQRQILYSESQIGQAKVLAAKQALLAMNASLTIKTQVAMIEQATLEQYYDVVLDCTDNLSARHWLNRYAVKYKLPLISGAALGWEGQLMQFDFSRQQRPCLACAIPENSAEARSTCANSGVIGPVLGVVGSMQAIAAIQHILAKNTAGLTLQHGVMQRYAAKQNQWLKLSVSENTQCSVCKPLST